MCVCGGGGGWGAGGGREGLGSRNTSSGGKTVKIYFISAAKRPLHSFLVSKLSCRETEVSSEKQGFLFNIHTYIHIYRL